MTNLSLKWGLIFHNLCRLSLSLTRVLHVTINPVTCPEMTLNGKRNDSGITEPLYIPAAQHCHIDIQAYNINELAILSYTKQLDSRSNNSLLKVYLFKISSSIKLCMSIHTSNPIVCFILYSNKLLFELK